MESETEQLWKAFRQASPGPGRVRLRRRLLEVYLPLLECQAGLFIHRKGLASGVDREDLISAGTFGLADAVEKFDPARRVKFETYAAIRIRGAIGDWMREIDWVPRGERERCRREGRELRRIDRAGESLLASAMGVATDQAMERLEEDDAFQGMLGCLDRIERRILEWRFVEDMTLAEIGASLGITESRISQMLREMMPRLKNELIRKGFRDGSCEDEVCETDNGR